MNEEIKKRIEQIKRGAIPCGYKIAFSGVIPNEWDIVPLSDILYNEVRPIEKPNTGYWRLGLRSHAKGTFHEFVLNPEDVSMDELYLVKTDDLIVNITFAWEHAIAVAEKTDEGKLVSHRFPTYVFQNGSVAGFYRYIILQKWFKELLLNISPGGAGRNRVMNKKDFLKLRCPSPTRPEQQKISEILTTCDKLICLKKELIAEKERLKKSCLSKMFPKQGSSVPEMRFPGFADAWEQRKLSEVLISLQNNTLSRADLSFEEGAALNVHYGDVLIKFGEYLDVKEEALPMIADTSIVAKYEASFLQNGDIIVADTAEDETVGKCSEIAGLTDEIAISGLHTMPYRPQFEFASGFLGYYMNSNSYHHQLLPLMQGIKVTSISKSAMQTTVICYPESVEEQAGISAFFRNLDHLITLHRRELVEMEKLKKALMQLLLTGIVRVS